MGESRWIATLLGSMEAKFYREMDRLQLERRFPWLFDKLRLQTARLYGPASAVRESKRFVFRIAAAWLGLLTGSTVLSVVDSVVWLQIAVCFCLLLPLFAYKNLEKQVVLRQRRILMELPELLGTVTLLVQAGETVQQAIHRCADQGGPDSPLNEEWKRLSRELRDHRPFGPTLEDFSKRCGVQEVSLFSTTVLLNFKRGGNEFVLALQDLSRTLWERRKALAKTLGEEASSKLVLPMVALFLVVMVIVAAPAVLLMDGP